MREQLARLPSDCASETLRHVPIEGVVLTDAELDHSLGIVLLREAKYLPLYGTTSTESVLERDSRILAVARAFADMPWTELPLDTAVELRNRNGAASGLTVEAFSIPADPPRFASEVPPGHTVGLSVRERASGRTCTFVPGCGGLTSAILERLARADVLLFDGTFWNDDEPTTLGISARTAREMDHLPISGPEGSLEQLAALPCPHRLYTHINNTNPVLIEGSPERAAVVRAGLVVGYDGLHMTI